MLFINFQVKYINFAFKRQKIRKSLTDFAYREFREEIGVKINTVADDDEIQLIDDATYRQYATNEVNQRSFVDLGRER